MEMLTLKQIGEEFLETSSLKEINSIITESIEEEVEYSPYMENGMEKETIKELIKELRKISKDIRIYNKRDFENLYIIPSTVEEWVCIYSFIYNYCFYG